MWSEQVAAQDKSVEEQLDERFADVVAARAAANGVAAEAARTAESEVAAAAQGQAAAPAEAQAATMVEPAAAADEPSPAGEHDCTDAVELVDVE